MIMRIIVGLVGLFVAMFVMRLVVDEARRVQVRVRTNEAVDSPRAVGRLRQDPRTGVYYPAD